MNKFVKTLVLAAVSVVGTATFTSVEAISSDEAAQSALARVPGATIANVTEFNRDYDHGRLEYEGEIHYNGYEYDFEIDADTGTFTNGKQNVNITKILKVNHKKRTAHQELFFFMLPNLEEEVVNFMDEMLTEEGDATMHYDEYDEVFECSVHNNACFDFML